MPVSVCVLVVCVLWLLEGRRGERREEEEGGEEEGGSRVVAFRAVVRGRGGRGEPMELRFQCLNGPSSTFLACCLPISCVLSRSLAPIPLIRCSIMTNDSPG